MDNIYDILNKFNSVTKDKPREQITEGIMEVAIEEVGGTPMTAKQKSFAKLAPPADKITFADKIAGAKKEVDEMLGDVAAEAMKKAVVGLKGEQGMEEGTASGQQPKIIKKNGKPVGEIGIDPDAPPGRPGQWYMKHYASGHNLGGYDSREEAMSELKHCLSQEMEEGNDFTGARQAAIKAGKPTFSVGGKTFKVTGDTSDEKMMEKKEKTLWPGTPEYEKKFPKTMKPGEKARSSTGGTIEKTATGVKHTAKAHDDEDEADAKADDGAPKKKGRPKGSKRALGAKVKGTSKLHRKPSIREEGDEAEGDDVKQAMALLKKHGYKVSKDLEEKAVSKAQQRFMGMVHAAQKGEKAASPEVAKVAKEMPKKAAKDYAKTKHAGLPEKVKAKKEESKEEVEETTTSGSVATAPAEAPKGKKGMVFGKGVYEGYEQRFKQLLTEGMSITASQDESGKKNLSVNATDEDAVKLAQILKLAGMEQAHGYEEACPACGQAPCGCEGLEEAEYANSPEEVGADTNTLVNTYSDGLDGQKTTGQTTIPVIAGQTQRMISQVREQAEERLWDLYKRYEAK